MRRLRFAIGVVEVASIAAGMRAADAMLKMAAVEMLEAQPTSPGKYVVSVAGDVASVAAAVDAGVAEAGEQLLGRTLIAHLHPQVLSAARGTHAIRAIDALGVVETTTIAAVVRAADAAVKAAVV
ncbi:MAG TPA: BMC domain-containing protein, partial [Symbiobacteriaceae bacterium]|nr:BMC domain-containing protein [Symbiobacteriaceae bacterium]